MIVSEAVWLIAPVPLLDAVILIVLVPGGVPGQVFRSGLGVAGCDRHLGQLRVAQRAVPRLDLRPDGSWLVAAEASNLCQAPASFPFRHIDGKYQNSMRFHRQDFMSRVCVKLSLIGAQCS